MKKTCAHLVAAVASLVAVGLISLLSVSCGDGAVVPVDEAGEAVAAGGIATIGRAALMHGANGLSFGPDGRLYVASVVSGAIFALDPESGELLERLGTESGVDSPDDLAFGPDGTLCWTDISFGDVGCRRPDGTSSVVAELGPGVNPITFAGDGRLFVAQCFMDDGLFEVDIDGGAEARSIRDDLGPGCGLNGMDWGPDGRLYGPRWFRGEVVAVDVDSGAMETVASGFGVPAAVKFDSAGRLHVLDSLRGQVARVGDDGTTEVVASFEHPGQDNLAFSSEDRLFVSSFADSSVVEVVEGGVRTVRSGGLGMPGGIALIDTAAGPRLVVADFFALRQLDLESGEELAADRDVIGFSDLGSTMSVHADGDRLALTSWFDRTAKVWSASRSELLATVADLALPIDALFFDHGLAISEYGAGRVIWVDPESPEERRELGGGLDQPAGLAARGADLFVAERGAGRVLQLIAAGERLPEPRAVAEGLEGPEGIAFDADGALYVVEADAGRVTRFLADQRQVLADELAIHVPAQGEFPSTMLFNGIAVGAGRAFVTSDVENRIYRIDL